MQGNREGAPHEQRGQSHGSYSALEPENGTGNTIFVQVTASETPHRGRQGLSVLALTTPLSSPPLPGGRSDFPRCQVFLGLHCPSLAPSPLSGSLHRLSRAEGLRQSPLDPELTLSLWRRLFAPVSLLLDGWGSGGWDYHILVSVAASLAWGLR